MIILFQEAFMEAIEQGIGYDINLWFQSWRSDFVGWLFSPFNYIGTEYFFIGIIAVLYWLINKRFARRVSFLFLLTMWVNSFCKAWWKRPRPYNVTVEGKEQVKLFHAFKPLPSYGIPSGHTMSAASFFGYSALESKKVWAKILLWAAVILMPISRLVHSAHYPQDVIVGLALALGMLLIYRFVEEKIFTAFKTASLRRSLGVLFIVSGLLTLLMIPINAEHEGLKNMVSMNAVFTGGVIGFILDEKKLNFDTAGRLIYKILRLAVGLAGVAVIFLGLKYLFGLFDDKNEIVYFIFRYIRYSLLGFWVGFGAPWLFVKLQLAGKEE
jgi:membrane-associated phospholipid phosphatase